MLVAGAVVEERWVLQRALNRGDVDDRAPTAGPGGGDRQLQSVERDAGVTTREADEPLPRIGLQVDVDTAETAVWIGDGAVDEHAESLVGQRLEADDAGARQQRAVDLEAGVLGGGAEKGDHAALDVGEHRVLLRLVETMDLVDEEHRALAEAPAVARPLHDLAQLGYAGRDGADQLERGAGHLGEDVGERRLAAAGRTPEDHRGHRVALERTAQHGPGADGAVLAGELVESARPHPRRQRRHRPGRRHRGGRRIAVLGAEQVGLGIAHPESLRGRAAAHRGGPSGATAYGSLVAPLPVPAAR